MTCNVCDTVPNYNPDIVDYYIGKYLKTARYLDIPKFGANLLSAECEAALVMMARAKKNKDEHTYMHVMAEYITNVTAMMHLDLAKYTQHRQQVHAIFKQDLQFDQKHHTNKHLKQLLTYTRMAQVNANLSKFDICIPSAAATRDHYSKIGCNGLIHRADNCLYVVRSTHTQRDSNYVVHVEGAILPSIANYEPPSLEAVIHALKFK